MADDVFDLGDDDLDLGSNEYVTTDDLLDRLILAIPLSIKTYKGDNGPYPAVHADVWVLTGEPHKLMPTIPAFLPNFRFSAGQLVRNLEPKLSIPRSKTDPRMGRPVLFVLDGVPSAKNKRVLAYGMQKITTQEQVDLGKAALRRWAADHPYNPESEAEDLFS